MTKRLLFALLFATRLTRLVAWFNRKKVSILCYHSVTMRQEANPDDPHKLHLRVDSFLSHLDYLQTHYHIISLAEFVRARRENINLPSDAVILTFDDGIRNFFTVVAPILLKRKIPATSFIVTGDRFTRESSALNGQWTPEDDDFYLSWNEVRKLAAQGLQFGSHTCNHYALPDIPLGTAHNELEESLKTLQSYLGVTSLPLQLTQSLGYSCAVTTKLGQNDMNCDLFSLRRTVIASDDNLPTFAARLSGLTSWYGQMSDLLSGTINGAPESSAIGYDPGMAKEFKT